MSEKEFLKAQLEKLLEEQEEEYRRLWDVQDDIESIRFKLARIKYREESE